jgi:hypothetical protein
MVGQSKQLFPSAAPARTPDFREDPPPVPMEIDHAVVAVDVDRYSTENNEENDNADAKENKGKKRQAPAATAAAFFSVKPAVRAVTDGVRHLAFAFRTFHERHGYNSCTPANSAK